MRNTQHIRAALMLLPGILMVLALGSLLLLPTGCSLVSGTLRIEHDFNEGPQQSTGTNVKQLTVNLNDDSDFRDNKDKIKSVDEVGFVFRATNNLFAGATGQIYISKTPILPLTAPTIRALGTLVVDGIVLNSGPGSHTDITYDKCLSLEKNQKLLHKLVKEGTFYLYGIASTDVFDITVEKLTAVVVVTIEL